MAGQLYFFFHNLVAGLPFRHEDVQTPETDGLRHGLGPSHDPIASRFKQLGFLGRSQPACLHVRSGFADLAVLVLQMRPLQLPSCGLGTGPLQTDIRLDG